MVSDSAHSLDSRQILTCVDGPGRIDRTSGTRLRIKRLGAGALQGWQAGSVPAACPIQGILLVLSGYSGITGHGG